MPELAEVEYYRKQWNAGLGGRIRSVRAREGVRVFRGASVSSLRRALRGSTLLASEARGKLMLFRFSDGAWLGLHLGMTGRLGVERARFAPGRHDHLVLYQDRRALVFSDMRQFGRVLFEQKSGVPNWWSKLPPALASNEFTLGTMVAFLEHHRRLPIKAALLLQNGFPGIGNWMADEILWRIRLHPQTPVGQLQPRDLKQLWQAIRFVCRAALKKIGDNFSDPPRGWFFHQRWSRGGRCPRDGTLLGRGTVGGRTTAWCPRCQKARA